jgi:opacity protein-like surface antigen
MCVPVLILSILLVGVGRADAQSAPPKVEVAGGYAFLYDHDLGESLPNGWFASAAGNFNGVFGVAAELSRSRRTLDDGFGNVPVRATFTVQSVSAGPTFALRGQRTTVFAHFLFGVVKGSAGASSTAAGTNIDVSASETAFAMQEGGGVDVALSDLLAVRIGGNLRFIRFEGATSREFQLVTGIVVRGGR